MKMRERKTEMLWIHKAMLLAFMDILITLAVYLAALLIRFDFLFSLDTGRIYTRLYMVHAILGHCDSCRILCLQAVS